MRILLQEHLDWRGPAGVISPFMRQTVSSGTERDFTHERSRRRSYTVEASRTGSGREGEESLYPLDAELNLPAESYPPEPRGRVAEETSKNSFNRDRQGIHLPDIDEDINVRGMLYGKSPTQESW